VSAFAAGTWTNNGFMIYDTTTTFPFATLDFQTHFTSVDTALTQNVGPRVVVQAR
jgi:hypothetical protein